MTQMFKSLNDAAKHQPCLAPGDTQVFYRKTRPMFWVPEGYPNLEADYALLGTVAGTDLDELFCALQGENWSPEGEARDLIRSCGLSYTSMSVGDIVQIGDTVHVCEFAGWKSMDLVRVR